MQPRAPRRSPPPQRIAQSTMAARRAASRRSRKKRRGTCPRWREEWHADQPAKAPCAYAPPQPPQQRRQFPRSWARRESGQT
eukprot:5557920-Alexandrium_andersonii.AAC.1